jgi:peptide/nickel transport system ATP-binding protein
MPIDAESPLLEVSNLKVSFRTKRGVVTAADGVSFTVGQREILGIVGESGSGKSISVMSVLGLINDPNAVIEGSIKFQGRELIGLPAKEMRRLRGSRIAMIFQDPMTAMTPVYTIGRQITEQIRVHEKISPKAALARAVDLLNAVGIPAPASAVGRYPHELSGGMRQRAMIAMALSCNPALLLADEPTTALDVTVQAQILELLLKLRQDFGSSVILITHDMGVIAEVADRVMVMYAGRIVERGTKSQLFADPWHPYTWGLLGSIPPLDGERLRRLPSIPGLPPSLLALPKGCSFGPRCRWRMAGCTEAQPALQATPHAGACFIAPEERPAKRQASLETIS